MPRNLIPIFALLAGTLFLYFGNGLQSLLLPVRGAAEHFPTSVLGFLGTFWALGFVLGCFFAPLVVRRIGHVRAFASFIALNAIIVLMTGLYPNAIWWVALRSVTGFATAGTSMIVESWLNERADNETRGTVYATYIAVTLVGVMGGQMMLPLGDVLTPALFMVCGIFYCVALLPTTLSTAASPQPLQSVRLDIKGLIANSPIASAGVLLTGIANGAFGTLGAVFGTEAGLSTAEVATLMSLAIFAGALFQIPTGRLSDKMDRRLVLAGLSAIAAFSGWLLVMLHPSSVLVLFVIIFIYGGTANSLYPIAAAHANDLAAPEDFVKVSGGLLLLYGIGTVLGPTVGGTVMAAFGPYALFAITAIAHVVITVYAVFRSRVGADVTAEDKDDYIVIGPATSTTPEKFQMSPRANPEPEVFEFEVSADEGVEKHGTV
ncbi:MFS transporter [Rhizobium sp. L1K21]|uniref:MFS transporter n=1 Tax=Rhizobium sp. L1K21 TaxID=2954933 RepID=UPI002093DE08|nr:MFS transporter [Rhizobium sp. L1K21]MCO6185089.1 MFS transporter [Rhizobium sp. L1K21]